MLTLKSSTNILQNNNLLANGGLGGSSSPGGIGGDGQTGGVGGIGGSGGKGGNGSLTVSLSNPVVAGANIISAKGGDAGAASAGGKGGAGNVGAGGNGGQGGNAGSGGNGGKITLPSAVFANGVATAGTKTTAGTGGAGGLGSPNGLSGLPGATGSDGIPGTVIPVSDGSNSDDEMWRPIKRQRKTQTLRLANAVTNHSSFSANATDSATEAKGQEEEIGAESNHLRPVAFVQPVLKINDSDLPFQNILLGSESEDTGAKIGSSRIFVAKGAAAFVVASRDEIAILGLHECSSGDIALLVDGQEIFIRSGEQAIVTTNSNGSWKDISPIKSLAIRSTSEHKTKNGSRILISEFSIASAYFSLPVFKNLASSSIAEDRRLHGKIAKNAAVLQVLTAIKGPYKPISKY